MQVINLVSKFRSGFPGKLLHIPARKKMHVIYQETERPELLYHGVLQSEVTPGYHETEHLTTGTISFHSLDIDKEMQCYAKMKFMSEFRSGFAQKLLRNRRETDACKYQKQGDLNYCITMS